jgi:hypothetical protein
MSQLTLCVVVWLVDRIPLSLCRFLAIFHTKLKRIFIPKTFGKYNIFLTIRAAGGKKGQWAPFPVIVCQKQIVSGPVLDYTALPVALCLWCKAAASGFFLQVVPLSRTHAVLE